MANANATAPEVTSGSPKAAPKGKSKAQDRGKKVKVMGVEMYIKG